MGLMILNGAYISNPPLPKINLKNDTAVSEERQGRITQEDQKC